MKLLNSARELGEEVVEGYAEILSPTHPLTLAVGVNLAIVYRAGGEWGKARDLDETNLAALNDMGMEHWAKLAAHLKAG